MVGLAVLGAIQGLLLRAVLLLEDVKIGIDAVVGDGLGPQQLVEVVPFSLQSIVLVFASRDDGDESVDDLKALLLHFNTNFDKSII
jgi:hypothetical protein